MTLSYHALGWTLASVLVAGIVLGALPQSDAAAQSGPGAATPRQAILIEGDEDFCNDEDGDGVVGDDDGIVNCSTADGSPENPYTIAGWSITLLENDVCTDKLTSATRGFECGLPGRCVRPAPTPEGALVPLGGLSLCLTTKHVVVRDVQIRTGSPVFLYEVPEGNGCGPNNCTLVTVGANVWGASNVTFHNLTLTAYSTGVSVRNASDLGDGSWPARNIRFDSSRIQGASRTDSTQAIALATDSPEASRLIVACNAQLELRDSRVDAIGHNRAIGSGDGIRESCNGDAELVLERVTISNATRGGVSSYGRSVTIRHSTFLGNGALGFLDPSPTGASFPNLFVGTQRFEVVNNDFRLSGTGVVGIAFETRGTGLVELNRFTFDAVAFPRPFPSATAVVNFAGFACGASLEYNDLGPFRVVNRDPNCDLWARRNWWGLGTGPSRPAQSVEAYNQVEGRVDVAEWLRLPPRQLPVVVVAEPKAGTEVFGLVRFQGSASVMEGSAPVSRVELARDGETWDEALVAEGAASWAARWDTGAERPGPLDLRIRGCVEADCGFPIRFGLTVVPFPLPPIALLRAGTQVAKTLESVRLDASGSYSPQGRPIAAYRFHLGDGADAAWTEEPFARATYETPGTFRATLDVRDLDGFESITPGAVTLRISQEGAASLASIPAIPAPAPPAILMLLVVACARRLLGSLKEEDLL